MKKFFVLSLMMIIAAFLQSSPCQAVQDFFQDTVWVKTTDQVAGFYQVKFSNTDSMIVAHGVAFAYIYKTSNGEQIKRLNFNAEVHFFNNDENFIQLAPSRDRLIIFDTKTFEAIDTLEFDGETIADIEISNDEKYLVAVVASGFRIWDLNTKKIIRTKTYKKEENQTNFQIEQICFNNDNSKIIATEYRDFVEPEYPHNQYFSLRHNIYDFNTFDSVATFIDKAYYRLSNTNKYIAFKRSSKEYGVEIYDFTTKELVQKLEINGYDLTGIEFSPDDKFIITTNCFGALMRIWDIEKGEGVHDYIDGGYGNLDISSDGKYIIASILDILILYKANYGGTFVPEKEEITKTIYPNPTNGNATIEFYLKNSGNTIIKLVNNNGEIIKTFLNTFLEAGNQKIEINTTDIPSGNYYIDVETEKENIFFQLIINH